MSNSYTEILMKEIDIISKKTGVNPKLIIVILSIALIFVFLEFFDDIIVCIIGTIFPIYWSVKAIETKGADDDKQWLTYWVCYAAYYVIDMYAEILLGKIPYYFIFKLVFLLWLSLPNFNGALVVYNNVIIKIFKKYEEKLEDVAKNIGKEAKNIADQAKQTVADNQAELLTGAISMAAKAKDISK